MEELIRNIIYLILTGVGVALVKEVLTFINKKIDEVQANKEITNYQKLNQYVDKTQEIINNVVLSVSQTYTDSLKQSGDFNKEAQEQAKNKAIEMANKLITEESKNAIIVLYGDFNSFVDVMIESFVKQNKDTNKN